LSGTTMRDISRRWRYWLLLAVVAASVVGIALHKPIPQDATYHAFADRRTVLGVPNFWNVISNLPFLLVGIAGLRALRRGGPPGPLQPLYPAYAALFLGVILVAFGSGYYHLAPNNGSLTWDRLPMTMVFMAFLALVVGDRIDPQLGRRCLPFLLLIGVLSVVYWHASEVRGNGDLRPYVLVQFLPLALVPLITVIFPPAFSKVYYIWGMLGAYAAAKVLEVFDERVFRALGVLSGHTLKHLAAAAGVYFLVLASSSDSAG
ncbi:MAG: ceramidase domain-containing protein, partial [Thermoanaerobaculia bacterium]